MPPLPLPSREPEPPSRPEELFSGLKVTDDRLDNLWGEQVDAIRSYMSDHVDSPDVALELPTGSGKTLVGLLLAEWRRQYFNERTAFVCPTNQLARQVHGKAAGYGIETVLLVGPSERWNQADAARFEQGGAVAITNYHHLFNRTPRIRAQTLILDDAHAAEGAVADRWSLRFDRETMEEGYRSVLRAIAPELAEHRRRALSNDDLDPAHRSRPEVLLPDATRRVSEELARVIPSYVDGNDAWFAWDAIEGSLETCLIYASWSEILIRPFIAPTFSQDSYFQARQRVYLSATMGAGGELERSFGRESISRVPQPSSYEGSGRRFVIAPGVGRDGADANRLIRKVVERIGRVLFIGPGAYRLERAANSVLPAGIPRLGAADVEDGIEPFTSKGRAALLLANRYDGIDLPDQACQLIILSGLPSGSHLQERFLFDQLGAQYVLAERIRTRITQGAGRATRSRRDTAVVVLHGNDLTGFLNPPDARDVLRSEIQAELELAFHTAGLQEEEILESIDSFLAQDDDWKPSEVWLQTYAREHPKREPEGADCLAAAAPHEITAWREAWRGSYEEATVAAQRAVAALTHPSMAAYRAWWQALAASWSTIELGADAPRSIELAREAGQATQRMNWRPRLGQAPPAPSEDDELAMRAAGACEWLRGRCRSPKLEQELSAIKDGIHDDRATEFEIALQQLGVLLGFEAERPATEEAAPDGVWRDGERLWVVWEAKTEQLPTGEIAANLVRQAASHPDWIRHRYGWPSPEKVLTVMVTPRTKLRASAEEVAADHLHRVSPEVVRELAAKALKVHHQLSPEMIGMDEEQAVARMAALLKLERLDTQTLVAQLSAEPMG